MRNPLPVYLVIMTAVALGALVLTAILLHNAPPPPNHAPARHQSASAAAILPR